MAKFTMRAKEFKKMADPVNKQSKHIKYVCYIQAASISCELADWMKTNPRDPKMTTDVARTIQKSLEENSDFHELNRGIVLSAESVEYDNKYERVTIELVNGDIHGNIDGGHTRRAIFDAQKNENLSEERYVFMEIFVGLSSPVELAAARNTSVQVDLKSREELNKSFEILKETMRGLPFENRIAYKMNQHYGADFKSIDVREVITILNMFNQSLPDIFALWDRVEVELPTMAGKTRHRYGSKKYSKYTGEVIEATMLSETDIRYLVPKGIMYPIVGTFRALVQVDTATGKYSWRRDPFEAWESMGPKLVGIVLDEKEENPEYLGKSRNLWSNLFKEMLLYRMNIQ